MSKMFLPLTVAMLATLGSSTAAEIRLRSDVRVESSVVTLADVAEIATTNPDEAERLGAIELGLAPGSGDQRTLRLREIEDALSLAGENLSGHRISGASEIGVTGPLPVRDPIKPTSKVVRPAVPRRYDRVERLLTESILDHLRTATEQQHGWTVEIMADAETLDALNAADAFRVSGAQAPFAGRQTFRVACETAEGPQEYTVTADIEQAPTCVVLKRAISRGTILGPGDVELAVPREGTVKPTDSVFDNLEQLYGKELTQTMQAGAVVKATQLQSPILVKRGQAVTVYSRAVGVTVRTTARAKDDGSLSSLIAVETIDTRQSFFARVCGPQEVEVLAAAPSRPTAPTPAPAVAVREPVAVAEVHVEAPRQVARNEIARTERSSWLAPSGAGATTTEGLKWRARSSRTEGGER